MNATIYADYHDGKTEVYYCHYTICDQTPVFGDENEEFLRELFDLSMWKEPTEEDKRVLKGIPMDGKVYTQGVIEVPVLDSCFQFNVERVLFQKSDNNGCSVFACKNRQVVDTMVQESERMNWSYLPEIEMDYGY